MAGATRFERATPGFGIRWQCLYALAPAWCRSRGTSPHPFLDWGLSPARLHFARPANLVLPERIELSRPKTLVFETSAPTDYATGANFYNAVTRGKLVDGLRFELRLPQGQVGLQSTAPNRMRLSSVKSGGESGSRTRTRFHVNCLANRLACQCRPHLKWRRAEELNPHPFGAPVFRTGGRPSRPRSP